MIKEESRLNLAYQNLKTVPKALINSHHLNLCIIDVSNNRISDVSFLKYFKKLSSIILDHNEVDSETVFPVLEGVKILWLNHNNISEIANFMQKLSMSFPDLQQLSLMGNPGVPLCHEDSYYQYIRYRLYVISCFQRLEHLDDRPVTDHERQEAQNLFGSPILDKMNYITDVVTDAVSKVRRILSPSPTPNQSNVI